MLFKSIEENVKKEIQKCSSENNPIVRLNPDCSKLPYSIRFVCANGRYFNRGKFKENEVYKLYFLCEYFNTSKLIKGGSTISSSDIVSDLTAKLINVLRYNQNIDKVVSIYTKQVSRSSAQCNIYVKKESGDEVVLKENFNYIDSAEHFVLIANTKLIPLFYSIK